MVAPGDALVITEDGRTEMNRKNLISFAGKRILLLQGPMGPFFARLARDLVSEGAQVLKVDFNGGDRLFSPRGSIAFRGHPAEWPEFFEQLLTEHQIDIVLLFGDCRRYHRIACKIACRRDVKIGVFEEGYIRPDYITFEQNGVNGFSQISRSPAFYRDIDLAQDPPAPVPVGKTIWHAAFWAVLYYTAGTLLWPLFRHYRHHRPFTILETFPWLRSLWRKGWYAAKERQVLTKVSTTLSGRYFLLPLQVYNDGQICMHSPFDSVADFIRHVLESFAQHAPPEVSLIIKHHPMDRGYSDYRKVIREQSRALGIEERVIYAHDQHLPTMLQHARGVVVVNSTVGLSAMHHGVPLKVCGSAVYDMEGLTFQGSLDNFWKAAPTSVPDRDLYLRFRSYLIEHTQLNGSFYRQLGNPGSEQFNSSAWLTSRGGFTERTNLSSACWKAALFSPAFGEDDFPTYGIESYFRKKY